MILLIDNYDSFTYNLVQALGTLGAEIETVRNDAVTPEEVELRAPERIVISPGPCTPRESGVSNSEIRHDGAGVFAGLPNPFSAMRYHSLVVDEATLPPEFVVTARTGDDEVMGFRHREWPLEGVQFHPESYRTDAGLALLRNFLAR